MLIAETGWTPDDLKRLKLIKQLPKADQSKGETSGS